MLENTSEVKNWGWKDQISVNINKSFLADAHAAAQNFR